MEKKDLLPKKWYAKKNATTNDFLNENSVRKDETDYEEEEGDDKVFVYFPAFKEDRGFGMKEYHLSTEVKEGYTFITSEQLIVHALNATEDIMTLKM